MATAPVPATPAEPEVPPRPEDDPRFDPAEEFVRPPDEDFWEKYSRRLEFPTSWVGALLIWAIAFAMFYAYSKYLSKGGGGEVPVRMLDVGGEDDSGEGSAGSGGTFDPILEGSEQAFDVPQDVKPPPELANAQEAFKENLKDIKKTPRGQGPGQGRGVDNSVGKGPGGTGNDGTWKRGVGWTLRFKFEDARDFCKQLASAEAIIFVPEGGIDSKKGMLYADMNNPSVGRAADKSDPIFSGRLGMYEQDPRKIAQMLKFLGAPGGSTYGVFFPTKFQDELAQKEIAFRNRRKEDIENTIFSFVSRGGQYEIRVVDQKVKK